MNVSNELFLQLLGDKIFYSLLQNIHKNRECYNESYDSSPQFNNDQFPTSLVPFFYFKNFFWVFENNPQASYLLIFKYNSVFF